jgi:hypothetical protein
MNGLKRDQQQDLKNSRDTDLTVVFDSPYSFFLAIALSLRGIRLWNFNSHITNIEGPRAASSKTGVREEYQQPVQILSELHKA